MKKRYIGIIIILLFITTFMLGCDNVKSVSSNAVENQISKDDEYEVIIKNVKCPITKNTAGVLKINKDLKDTCKISGKMADELKVDIDKHKKVIKISTDERLKENSVIIELGVKVNDLSLYDCKLTLDCDFTDIKNVNGDIDGLFGGDINITDVDKINMEFDGAGDISLKGNCTDSVLLVKGAMKLQGFDLKTKNTDVTLKGVGECEVYASEKLDAELDGVGKITYDGNPKNKNTASNGLGSIKSR